MMESFKLYKTLLGMVVSAGLLILSHSAQAELTVSTVFNGTGGSSIDGCGGSFPCDISAVVPTGSTVEVAFLYSTMNSQSTVPTVNFDGTFYSGADWTALGVAAGFLQAYRADVTSQVSAAIGGGSATPFTFQVLSELPSGQIDGEVLAIIYSNPAGDERTIAFLDGFSDTDGDQTTLNLSEAITAEDLTNPDYQAILSLGIGFGAQDQFNDPQNSLVDINGVQLTACAGGTDDGQFANGALITVGGVGDSLDGPNCDITGQDKDDELYDFTPFLDVGIDQILIDTVNPSDDDNIFFAAIDITARAGVNAPPPEPDDDGGNNGPPPSGVPEPLAFPLLGIGLMVAVLVRRRRMSIGSSH